MSVSDREPVKPSPPRPAEARLPARAFAQSQNSRKPSLSAQREAIRQSPPSIHKGA